MSSNGDAIKQMLSEFRATTQQQNYANQTTGLFSKFQNIPALPGPVLNSLCLPRQIKYMIISPSAAHDKNEAQTTGNTAGLKPSFCTEGYSTFLEEEVGKNKISINRLQSGNLYSLATRTARKISCWGRINPLSPSKAQYYTWKFLPKERRLMTKWY